LKIQFLGAAKVVTGSNYLITTDKYKILLDCGLFQGSQQLEKLNYEDFQFNPSEIDFVILSHAHIDHSGRIPKLVKEGFEGKILCTKATSDLCELMLVDSGHIQESDADWENRKRKRSGKPLIEPLYTSRDALLSLKYFSPALYEQKIKINEDISVRFKDAGHILGSSIVELWITEKGKTVKIVFSGDLGMKNKPIIKDPSFIEEADYLIIESTYGDRLHDETEKRTAKLTDIINKTTLRGGTVIIPSFAVGRTQELIYELNKYYEYNNDIEAFMKIPIYIDSPMAVSATEIFQRNSYAFNDEAKKLVLNGDNPFEFENLHYVKSQEESMRLNNFTFPKVIISASGMCNAGRVRHHLKHNLWKAKNSVVFVGYQAEGTLGRIIKDGIKKVKLLGEDVVINAEIHDIEGFSAHADQNGLIEWVGNFKKLPKKIFVVHGEDESSKTFAQLLSNKFNVQAIIPTIGYSYEITEDSIDKLREDSSNDVMETIKLKESIKKELQEVYNQFENLVTKTDTIIDENNLKKDYDELKNKLIELQQKLMDVNMIISD